MVNFDIAFPYSAFLASVTFENPKWLQVHTNPAVKNNISQENNCKFDKKNWLENLLWIYNSQLDRVSLHHLYMAH